MNWWNTLHIVERAGTFFNWVVALSGVMALPLAARASTLRDMLDQERQKTVNSLQEDLLHAKQLASPPILLLRTSQIERHDDSVALLIQFDQSKNELLGELFFEASLETGVQSKILDFWPTKHGPVALTGDNSKNISQDGKSASLRFSLISVGHPTIRLTLSAPAPVTIRGSHLQEPLRFGAFGDVEAAPSRQ